VTGDLVTKTNINVHRTQIRTFVVVVVLLMMLLLPVLLLLLLAQLLLLLLLLLKTCHTGRGVAK